MDHGQSNSFTLWKIYIYYRSNFFHFIEIIGCLMVVVIAPNSWSSRYNQCYLIQNRISFKTSIAHCNNFPYKIIQQYHKEYKNWN